MVNKTTQLHCLQFDKQQTKLIYSWPQPEKIWEKSLANTDYSYKFCELCKFQGFFLPQRFDPIIYLYSYLANDTV